MITAVAETHTAIWYVFADARLSAQAKQTIEESVANRRYIGLSAISLIEVVYLIEKNRLAPDTLERLTDTLQNPDRVLVEVPVDGEVVEYARQIPRDQVPDLPDRVIAGTALRFGVPVISRDRKIRATSLQTIW